MKFNHLFFVLICFIFFIFCPLYSQTKIIGLVKDAATTEPLAYVNIYSPEKNFGSVSDTVGKFVLQNLPVGEFNLVFQLVGYQKLVKHLVLSTDTTLRLDVQMKRITLTTNPIDVQSTHWISPLAELFQGSHQLNRIQIVDQPGAFEDPLKALQSITGVLSHSDYTSNLYIRGSQPKDQAIVLDGLLLQNPYRGRILGFGGISAVNSDVIENLKLSLGGFPASYGNRLGGLIEIKTKDAEPGWQNRLSLNLLSARYYLNGPIHKNFGIVFSARRTYYDFLIKKLTSTTTTYPFFSDLFVKLIWKLNPALNFRLTTLAGKEGTNLINNARVNGDLFTRAQNILLSLSLSGFVNEHLNYQLIVAHQFNMDSLFSSSSVIGDYSRYKTEVRRSNILANIEWEPRAWANLAMGAEIVEVNEQAAHRLKHLINSNPTLQAKITYRAFAFYLNNHFKFLKTLRTKLGARADYSTINNKLTIDPRISLRWQIYGDLYMAAAWGIFRQIPQMINLESKHEPITDPAVLSKMRSPQLNYWGGEISCKLFSKLIMRLEAYYKITNFLRGEYVAKIENSSTTIRITDDWKSMAKGLELNLAYMDKNWQTQIGYVYSIAKFKKNRFSGWEYQYFDNRHWLNWSFSSKISSHVKFMSLIKLTSGFPINEPVGWTKSGTNQWTIIPVSISKRHSYFRWDLRVAYHRKNISIYFEIINVTNHRNFNQALYYVSGDENGTTVNRDVIYMLPRMPVFGFSFNF